MSDKEIIDLHIHTKFSYDGKSDMEEYIIAALSRGDKAIGFSEHYDYDCTLCGKENSAPLCDLKLYSNEVNRLKEKYGEKIKILFGIEFGYEKGMEEHCGELVQKYRFDYVINSVHLYKSTDYYLLSEVLKEKDADYVYRSYLETVEESLHANYPWQIAGHIGYPLRYAPFKNSNIVFENYPTEYSAIINTLIDKNKYLELNSSTKGNGAFLPGEKFLREYALRGGKNITYGSDAHSVERYKDGEDAVTDIAKKYFLNIFYFENGRAVSAICQ